MSKAFRRLNVLKGIELEDEVHKERQQQGFDVEPHDVLESGVDSKAFKNGKIVIIDECWNWPCGGYPHPKQWRSTIDNLQQYPEAERNLICVGVHPTSDQYKEACSLDINIVYGDTVNDVVASLRQYSGVITQRSESASDEPIEPVSYECPYSSIDDLELDMWRPIYSDLFSD